MKLKMPKRTESPRRSGLTMILEKGLPINLFTDYIESYHSLIDVMKFTSGMGLVDAKIDEKIKICKQYNIDCYFGGTLFEKYFHQNILDDYIELLKSKGLSSVEISDGTISIEDEEKTKLINKFKDLGFNVYVEIGSKDTNFVMPPSVWISQMQNALNAGADHLIVEGRESATAGLYRTSGEMRTGLLQEIINNIDIDSIIFEAPTKSSQCYLIEKISHNVNLGNIPLSDINMLEVQRLGLRYDTFHVFDDK